jgi:sugar lactone lactonase YvrE
MPSGLGWLPDGDLLVVSANEQSVYRYDGDALVLYADLSAQTKFVANEMVVNSEGWAYVGDPAFLPFQLTDNDELGRIFLIKPDGDVSLVSDEELWFPNGCIITPGGDTLIIAETFGNQLTAFDIASDGTLSNKREWASFGDNALFPDGLCQDEEGGIWVASGLPGGQWIRVIEGGEITDSLPKVEGYTPIGCQFGGPDGKTLFLLMSTLDRSNGRIDIVEVDIAGVIVP